MPLSLRQLVKVADQLQAEVARLQVCIAGLAAAESRAQPPAAPRRQRWVGPVDGHIHAERGALYYRRFSAAMALGLDATAKGFAARHNLNVSEISRWLSLQVRGIAPASSVDISIRRALDEDIVKYEALLAKHHGAAQIPNSSPRFSRSISP